MTTSTYKCPVCGEFLKRQRQSYGNIFVWCANGPCPSLAANRGALGTSEYAALIRLEDKIQQEAQLNRR